MSKYKCSYGTTGKYKTVRPLLGSSWSSEHILWPFLTDSKLISNGSSPFSFTCNSWVLLRCILIQYVANCVHLVIPVSCDGDGEAVIFLSGILHARHFGIHSETIPGFTVDLLQRTNTQRTTTAIVGCHGWTYTHIHLYIHPSINLLPLPSLLEADLRLYSHFLEPDGLLRAPWGCMP